LNFEFQAGQHHANKTPGLTLSPGAFNGFAHNIIKINGLSGNIKTIIIKPVEKP